MSRITIDLAAARHALRTLTPRTVTLVVSIADLDVPMSGSDWTVGQAAAHVLLGAELYAEYAAGVERPASIDRANVAESHRRKLAALATRGAPQMGAELQRGIDAYLHAIEGRDAEELLPWHQDRLRCATMTGLLMGEQLLHGYDIAQTLGAEWPIGPEPARLTLQALLDVLPAFVDSEAAKGVDATYELAVDVTVTDGDAALGAGFKQLLRNP